MTGKLLRNPHLLPLERRDLGMGSESFLLMGWWWPEGVAGGGAGRLHQTSLSPAVSSVEQSEEMEMSVTHEECSDSGELMLAPDTASQI